MNQDIKIENQKVAPPKPTRKSRNIEFQSLTSVVTPCQEGETPDSRKENKDIAADADTKECNGELRNSILNGDLSHDLVNDKDDADKSGDIKQNYFSQRSISTPEARVTVMPNLSERPRTYGSTGKDVMDSPKPRIGRKKSILKTVVEVFRKKPEPPVNECKYSTVNINKPPPLPGNDGFFKGALFKMTDGAFKLRSCFLRTDMLVCHFDEEYKCVEECLSFNSLICVQLVDDQKADYKFENTAIFCFEIWTSTDYYLFGSKSKEDRIHWLRKIGECLNHKLNENISDYQRIGWLYIREGINGVWSGAWIALSNRHLFYKIHGSDTIHKVDLRKAKCIALQPVGDGDCVPQVFHYGPCMLVNHDSTCLYFRTWSSSDTEMWYNVIKQANVNGTRLEDQQLYSYDIPVIVEKCINFIYLHGTMLTGIYRRTGHSSRSEEIISKFKADAWATQLPSDIYSGYDVARAFKKFFYTLSEPVIVRSSQEELHEIRAIENEEQRVRLYQAVFENYPPIYYSTLRMLLRHLHFIVEYKEKNLMTSENVANVWGVTMMHSQVHDDAHFMARDCELATDLINLSDRIFPESEKERHQETLVRETWERHLTNTKRPINGNFRIWIYYGSKDGSSYNVELGLHKTAYEVCDELALKVNMPVNRLILEELILNDHLIRPIHYDEKVLDVVLKWAYWNDPDRKDNCLVVSPLDKYEAYLVDSMFPAMVELKFADKKTKNFQTCTFELNCRQLTCYKDASKSQVIRNWNIEDIEWYIGNEKNRHCPTKHTITFVEKESQKRSDSAPWFGNVLSFSTEFIKVTCVSSLWKESHKREFLPLAMEFLMKRCQENHK